MLHGSSGIKPKITYWQTGICLDYSNTLLFIESAEPFLHHHQINVEDVCGVSVENGVLVTVLTLAASSEVDHDSCVLLSFAADHIESLITQWYPGMLICVKYLSYVDVCRNLS